MFDKTVQTGRCKCNPDVKESLHIIFIKKFPFKECIFTQFRYQ